MATLMDTQTMRNFTADKEAELHNAQINERYKRLQNAEADQFAQKTVSETTYARTSVLTPEAPALENTRITEQTPFVTEFVREKVETPVVADTIEVAQVQAPVEIPAQMTVKAVSVSKQAQYSLYDFGVKLLE